VKKELTDNVILATERIRKKKEMPEEFVTPRPRREFPPGHVPKAVKETLSKICTMVVRGVRQEKLQKEAERREKRKEIVPKQVRLVVEKLLRDIELVEMKEKRIEEANRRKLERLDDINKKKIVRQQKLHELMAKKKFPTNFNDKSNMLNKGNLLPNAPGRPKTKTTPVHMKNAMKMMSNLGHLNNYQIKESHVNNYQVKDTQQRVGEPLGRINFTLGINKKTYEQVKYDPSKVKTEPYMHGNGYPTTKQEPGEYPATMQEKPFYIKPEPGEYMPENNYTEPQLKREPSMETYQEPLELYYPTKVKSEPQYTSSNSYLNALLSNGNVKMDAAGTSYTQISNAPLKSEPGEYIPEYGEIIEPFDPDALLNHNPPNYYASNRIKPEPNYEMGDVPDVKPNINHMQIKTEPTNHYEIPVYIIQNKASTETKMNIPQVPSSIAAYKLPAAQTTWQSPNVQNVKLVQDKFNPPKKPARPRKPRPKPEKKPAVPGNNAPPRVSIDNLPANEQVIWNRVFNNNTSTQYSNATQQRAPNTLQQRTPMAPQQRGSIITSAPQCVSNPTTNYQQSMTQSNLHALATVATSFVQQRAPIITPTPRTQYQQSGLQQRVSNSTLEYTSGDSYNMVMNSSQSLASPQHVLFASPNVQPMSYNVEVPGSALSYQVEIPEGSDSYAMLSSLLEPQYSTASNVTPLPPFSMLSQPQIRQAEQGNTPFESQFAKFLGQRYV